MNPRNKVEEKYVLLLSDIVCILLSYAAALFIRYGNITQFTDTYLALLLEILLYTIFYMLIVRPSRNFVLRGYLVEIQDALKYSASMGILIGLTIFLFRESEHFSRLVFGYFIAIDFVLMYGVRCCIKKILRRHFRSERVRINVMVVTDAKNCETLLTDLLKNQKYMYDINAVTVWDRKPGQDEVAGVPVVADKNTMIEVARTLAVDEVFLYLPEESNKVMASVIQEFEIMGVICHQNIGLSDKGLKVNLVENFGGFLVATYSINAPDYQRLTIKRVMDIAGGLVGILFFLILYPFIGLAIKIESRGPVLFSQVRIGKNGRRFRIYKFRSMYMDAEERKKELEAQNEVSGLMFKMKNDPRVTKVGRFLRRTSLDEIPQFYNILKGDMSLVGTRPPTVEEFEQYTPYYRRRLCMTPGLTGMWQVSGRSDIKDFDEVVKLDLEYIDNWSLTLDIKILWQTLGTVLFRKGAK